MIKLTTLLRPPVLLALPVFVSFVAWALPLSERARHGFTIRANPTFASTLFLLGWYAIIATCAILGFKLGARTQTISWLDQMPDRAYYLALSIIGAAGVAYSYTRPFLADPSNAWETLRSARFNEFRAMLGYNPGPATLRYAACLSGSIALFDSFRSRRISQLDALNIGLLLAAAFLSSRLSLALATLLALGLYARWRPEARVRWSLVVLLVIAGFLLTTPLNYSRNSNFYRAAYGTANPFIMNAYETISYLAAPAQVSLGIANWATGHLAANGVPVSVIHRSGTVSNFEEPDVGWLAIPALGNRFHRSGEAAHSGAFAGSATYGGSGRTLLAVRKLLLPAAKFAVSAWIYIPASVDLNGLSMAASFPNGDDGSARVDVGRRGEWQRVSLRTRSAGFHSVGVLRLEFVGRPPRPGSNVFIDDVRADRLSRVHRVSIGRALGQYLVPTYLPYTFEDVTLQENSYRALVDVDGGLTTNSTVAIMYMTMGYWAFGLIAFISIAAGMLAGHAYAYRSYFFLTSMVVAYCFAEVWRTYLFATGIIHFLVFVLVGVPTVYALSKRILRCCG